MKLYFSVSLLEFPGEGEGMPDGNYTGVIGPLQRGLWLQLNYIKTTHTGSGWGGQEEVSGGKKWYFLD